VPLVDEDTSLVDGLGLEALLVNAGLQPLVEELVDGQTEHVIQLELLSSEQAVAVHAVEEGGSFEESPGVTFLEGEEFSGCLAEAGEDEMHSPDLTLVLEAVLADQLQLVVDALLLEGTPRGVEGGGV
jgi:hypothetical protein